MRAPRRFKLSRILAISLLTVTVLCLAITQAELSKDQSAISNFQNRASSSNKFGVLGGSEVATAETSPLKEISLPSNNSEPLGITIDREGNIWFAQNNVSALVKYNPSLQNFTTYPIPSKAESMIWFILFDSKGNLWFSNALQPYLWSFSPVTQQFANFSTGGQYVYPFSLAYDNKTQEIWFTSIYTDQIGHFKISGTHASLAGVINMVGPSSEATSGPKYGPTGLTIDSQGNIFVSNTFVPDIVEYSQAQHKFLHFWNLPSGSQPVGIALDPSHERIWFANHATSLFGYVSLGDGKVTEYATSLFSYLYDNITLPYWVQVTSNGQIWFDEHVSNKIARFDPTTGLLTEFQVPTFQSAPLRFVIDSGRGIVWFTEFLGGKLGAVDENQSCNCYVELSSKVISMSHGSAVVYLKYESSSGKGLANSAPPLISGSLATSGFISSNLTISSSMVNSSYYRITLGSGLNLARGNYSLTFCPQQSSAYNSTISPAVMECGTSILGSGSVSPTGLLADQLIVAGVIIAVALGVSLIFVRRWRHS